MMNGGKKIRVILQAVLVASFFVAIFGANSLIRSGNAAIIVPSIPDGQIVGRCVGWPTPRVEIEWSPNSPPGAAAPNSNSIQKMKDSGGWAWFFGGGYPGVNATRIDGSFAPAWNPTYPYPNFVPHDLRDLAVQIGSTYTYRVKYRPETPSANSYTVTIDAASCGAEPTPIVSTTPTPIPTPIPTPPPSDAGRIEGVCVWNNDAPEVRLSWSQDPPPGTGPANSNSLQKGDSYPSDPSRYWEFLPNNPSQYTYTDRAVSLNTQYQYRVKYRPSVPSINTYNVYVSATTCGGPASTTVPLRIIPSFQTVPPNVSAFLGAEGGDGTYTWSAPDGTLSNTTGTQVAVTYTSDSTEAVDHTVTVFSGGQSATAVVTVSGLETFKDTIELGGGLGNRYLLINDDVPVTRDPEVQLTLAHGFTQAASSSVTVQPANSLDEVSLAPSRPFQKYTSWNLCGDSFGCPEGLYTVYGVYTDPSGTTSPVVFDSITYLVDGEEGKPSITINNGGITTEDRAVSLTLWHGFIGIPRDEISMQLANLPELVDQATPIYYSAFVEGWDLCDGVGSICANGTRTVYAKFCARGVCQDVVFDDIEFASLWPEWGVIINDDAVSTDISNVQLRLNPWFDVPGTAVLISNRPDLSDAASGSFAGLIPWDLCYNRVGPCDTSGPLPVYVQYVNSDQPSWPDVYSPRYQDDILLTEEPVVGPAAILINNDEPTTTSRYVRLDFTSPYGDGPGVEMRPVNEKALNARDVGLLQTEFNGGVAGQLADLRSSPTGVVVLENIAPGTASGSEQFSELESVPARIFTPSITEWDLCDGATECPFGTYQVFVQYYKRLLPQAAGEGQAFAALGDLISTVYYDLIDYVAATPTPSATPTASPTVSVSPTGTPGPTPDIGETVSPTPTASISPSPVALPPWIPPVIGDAEPVIGPLAVASAVAVASTALIALIPLAGPGLIAFAWQSLLGVLGLLPKRKKTWGTVYDSNTKRPIPYAKVQLLDRNRRVLETRIADKDGRYGFLTTPESLQAQNVQIYLQPSAQEYTFPSQAQPSVDTFVYNNLYYGDLITVNDERLINFDIPLDPLKPSTAPLLLKSPSIALGASVAALADAGFWVGLIMVPLSFLLTPNPFTFGILCLFLGTASLRFFGIQEQPFGVVEDAQTGRPMPFALITLADASGNRVGFAVSDEQGRYFIVAERGPHQLTVHTPATVQPPRHYQQSIDVKKGWITRTIRL